MGSRQSPPTGTPPALTRFPLSLYAVWQLPAGKISGETMLPSEPPAQGPVERGTEVPWHTLDVAEVVERLEVDVERGLSTSEAQRRQQQFGANELEQAEGRSLVAILVDQFKSLIVLLLVEATGLAFFMGETIEAVAILVVILLNAAVGFFTEWKAQVALTALRRQAVPTAHVLRDGEEHEIAASELVPGDVVLLET